MVTVARRKLEAKEGPQGSISRLLVEANKRCAEAKIEAPRRLPIYPVGGEPGAQASAKLIKDRTLLGFARNWTGEAGRQGSIASHWSRRMGQRTKLGAS